MDLYSSLDDDTDDDDGTDDDDDDGTDDSCGGNVGGNDVIMLLQLISRVIFLFVDPFGISNFMTSRGIPQIS